MCEPMPVKDFRRLTDEDVTNLNLDVVTDNGDKGYILEVDLEYPPELHDSHNDFPLCAEHLEIKQDMLSSFSKDLFYSLNGRDVDKNKSSKLAPNLNDKKSYVVYYRNFKFYAAMGLKVTQIHSFSFYSNELDCPLHQSQH